MPEANLGVLLETAIQRYLDIKQETLNSKVLDLIAQLDLSVGAKFLYSVFTNRFKIGDDSVEISLEEIGKKYFGGVSDTTIWRYISELEEIGLLIKKRRGANKVNVYYITEPWKNENLTLALLRLADVQMLFMIDDLGLLTQLEGKYRDNSEIQELLSNIRNRIVNKNEQPPFIYGVSNILLENRERKQHSSRKRKKEKEEVESNTRKILDYFSEKFQEAYGYKPAINYAKDGAVAKKLEQQHGYDLLLKLIDTLFEHRFEFENPKFPVVLIGCLSQSWIVNKLLHYINQVRQLNKVEQNKRNTSSIRNYLTPIPNNMHVIWEKWLEWDGQVTDAEFYKKYFDAMKEYNRILNDIVSKGEFEYYFVTSNVRVFFDWLEAETFLLQERLIEFIEFYEVMREIYLNYIKERGIENHSAVQFLFETFKVEFTNSDMTRARVLKSMDRREDISLAI